ncbi:uncharacterized protein VTP21DRAFT_6549 [Calcarisporiella thermophila]|uniref:uncharacterized protein n=1 Tax=Calcarisporiella thermophila TaxID=911321 RepID=UPI003744865B
MTTHVRLRRSSKVTTEEEEEEENASVVSEEEDGTHFINLKALRKPSRLLPSAEVSRSEDDETDTHSFSTNGWITPGRAKESRRRQGRLLLVSLLENFCMVYGQSPERNRKLFFTLCKALSLVGIIDEDDYRDEMITVRNAYQRAFRNLVLSAMNEIKRLGEPRRFLTMSENSESPETGMSQSTQDSYFDSRLSHSSDSYTSGTPFSERNFGNMLDVESSRYGNDFEELRILGRGGFASVWEARNRLDGRKYAVKKIRLKDSKVQLDKIFREIKSLARLDHPNIVRYYSSWLEHASYVGKSHPSSEKAHVSYVSEGVYEENTLESRITEIRWSEIDIKEEVDYSGVDFVEDSGNAAVSRGSSARNDSSASSSPSASTHTHSQRSSDSRRSISNAPYEPSTRELTLFIQMQLCHATLQDYLTNRTRVDPRANRSLLRGILNGLVYLHERGLIHRDIKPSNIFLVRKEGVGGGMRAEHQEMEWEFEEMEELVPKIGDFGLVSDHDSPLTPGGELGTYMATTWQSESEASPGPQGDAPPPTRSLARRFSSNTSTRTSGIGTTSYAAPEQLLRRDYDTKVDIYSLGIVVFELYHLLTTGMERALALKDLREGKLPEEMVRRWPQESALVLWMTAREPQMRPSIREVLGCEVLDSADHLGEYPFEGEGSRATLELNGARESHSPIELGRLAQLEAQAEEIKRLRSRVQELELRLSHCQCN